MTRLTRFASQKLLYIFSLAFCFLTVFSFQPLQTARVKAEMTSPSPAQSDPEDIGAWGSLTNWPNDTQVVSIHTHVLPNGKVLFWQFSNNTVTEINTYLWDPTNNSWSMIENEETNLFCSGHAFRKDGRLLVTGGHYTLGNGVPDTNMFDYRTNAWIRLPDMDAGRWYPTSTTLSNGDVLTVEGTYETGCPGACSIIPNDTPEVFQTNGTWRFLNTAQQSVLNYPFIFQASNGSAFSAGPQQQARFLNTSGTGGWSSPSNLISDFGERDYGSAVMYDVDKILIVGGGHEPSGSAVGRPTATAEIIDLQDTSPSWSAAASMQYRRRQHNATILADGKVLVTGGTSYAGFNNPCGTVLPAEMWDPATNTWTTMASMSVARIYHSTAVLLPDGRVLSSGSTGQDGCPDPMDPETCYQIPEGEPEEGDCTEDQDDQTNYEIYSPPYLFKGDRPVISAYPKSITYNQGFEVSTTDAANITGVTFIRLSSVTHSFNENQRINHLSFTAGSGKLTISAPPNGNECPPGHYMLFILKGSDKIPSIARIIKISPRIVDNTVHFDTDLKTDLSVWRPGTIPGTGAWHVTKSTDSSTYSTGWGTINDVIVPGDYDGDGKTDMAVWRPGSIANFYVLPSSGGSSTTTALGGTGDLPVPGDFDGDGKTDKAVWRPSTGVWSIIQSSTGNTVTRTWGVSGDKPMAFDYDGDQIADFVTWRPSNGNWYILQSSTISLSSPVTVTVNFGTSGDVPVPGDFDGDGEYDLAVWREGSTQGTGTWYIRYSSTSSTNSTAWGTIADIPVPADYDGDGKTDVAIWRPSEGKWYIINSSTGNASYAYWGTAGDKPVPSAYVRF
jgi:hypothetical protein